MKFAWLAGSFDRISYLTKMVIRSRFTKASFVRSAPTLIAVAIRNDRRPVSGDNRGDAHWRRGESIPYGAARIDDVIIVFENAVTQMVLAQEPPDILAWARNGISSSIASPGPPAINKEAPRRRGDGALRTSR